MPSRRTPGRRAAARAKRMVVSSGNGATNTTLRIACILGRMRVVFLAPSYPPEMREYTRGLAEVGAEVYGVGDAAAAGFSADLKRHLHDYLQVPRIMDEDDVIARVSAWLGRREVDRVLANWEPLVILAARLRERLGLPGMSVDTVRGF